MNSSDAPCGGGTIIPYKGCWPKIHPTAFIAPGAVIIGDVEVGPEASVWFGAVLRGDVNFIRVGARSNIQDGTIIHVSSKNLPTIIGDEVTVGHRAVLHACCAQPRSFIGMSSTVLDGAVVETEGMVAAGALVTSGITVPEGELWAGAPAKRLRQLTSEERAEFSPLARQYWALAQEYMGQTSGN